MQGPIRNIILNVRQQVFVGRDSKSGRSALPLNFKGTANIEIGKSGDCSFFSFDLPIASDARQMASDNQSDTRSKRNDRDLYHEIALLGFDASSSRFGFNRNSRSGVSPQPSGRLQIVDH